MKALLWFGLSAFLSVGAEAALTTQGAHSVKQTWTGEISLSNCGAKHTSGTMLGNCIGQCVDKGSSYVLVSKGRLYKVAKLDDQVLRAYASTTVTLMRDLKSDAITASRIDAIANARPGSKEQS